MQIGSKLKRLRENKRISQQEIANLLGISQKTYSNIESDKSNPTLPQLSELSTFLDFNLLELLEKQGITFNQKNEKGVNNGIVHNNNVSQEDVIKDKNTIIQQQKEIIALLKEKLGSLEGK